MPVVSDIRKHTTSDRAHVGMSWDAKRCTFFGKGRINGMSKVTDGNGYDEGEYRPDPGHPDLYRCPVSTPAQDKRPLNNYEPITDIVSPSTQVRTTSSTGCLRQSLERSRTRSMEKPLRKSVEYYFVDKTIQQKEAGETNSFWLRSLCAQPVTEILGKYRRKTDFQRTRHLWSRMFSTPGEQAILQAWNKNSGRPRKDQTSITLNLSNRRSVTSDYLRLHEPVSPAVRPNYSSEAGRQKNDGRKMCVGDYLNDSNTVPDKARPMQPMTQTNDEMSQLYGERSRRKGRMVLQQRKYFSGNRKHPLTHKLPGQIQKSSNIEMMWLRPTSSPGICSSRDRNQSSIVRSAHAQLPPSSQSSGHISVSDVDQRQSRFPLVISSNNYMEPSD